jgi:hypothetical protein
MKHLVWLVLVGCSVDARTYTGPTISLQLTNNGAESVQDTSPGATFSIDVQVFTQAGGEDAKTTSTSSQVTSISTTFSLGGMGLPSPDYDREDIELDPTYMSKAPLVIPASAMGSTLAVHATAKDSDGLASNIVDFTIGLQ